MRGAIMTASPGGRFEVEGERVSRCHDQHRRLRPVDREARDGVVGDEEAGDVGARSGFEVRRGEPVGLGLGHRS